MLAKIRSKCVGIAGCGGLGSNSAVALARCGIGRLVLIDFDTVEISNLNRQYFFRDQVGQKKVFALRDNILRIDSAVAVRALDLKLDRFNITEVFAECDLVIEALDRADQKRLLIETLLESFPERYVIAASGLAGFGFNNEIRTERFGKLIVCGDFAREVSESSPPLAPRVGIVANMQANQALELLLAE